MYGLLAAAIFVSGFAVGMCVSISAFQFKLRKSFMRQLEKDYVITRRKQCLD